MTASIVVLIALLAAGFFGLGWIARADFDAGVFRGEPRQELPATARKIRRARRRARLDLQRALRRTP